MSEEHKGHRHHHSHHKRTQKKRKLGKNGIICITIAAVLAVMMLIFLIVQVNSYGIALGIVGLNKNTVHVIAQNCYDLDGCEFRVIEADAKNGDIGLAVVTKNKWGFWGVSEYRVSNMGVDPHFANISWAQPAGVKTFSYGDDTAHEQEWHYAYCGDNALKLVEFLPEQIPGNVTVNIQQAGGDYWIHVVSFADEDVAKNFDVKALLVANGCIPAE